MNRLPLVSTAPNGKTPDEAAFWLRDRLRIDLWTGSRRSLFNPCSLYLCNQDNSLPSPQMPSRWLHSRLLPCSSRCLSEVIDYRYSQPFFHRSVFLARATRNVDISNHPEIRSIILKSQQRPVRLPICVVVVSITALRPNALGN